MEKSAINTPGQMEHQVPISTSKQPPQEPPAGSLSDSPFYDGDVQKLQDELLKYPQVSLDVAQFFVDGLYARLLEIPAGIILTGKIHKKACLNVLLKGEIDVAVDIVKDGEKVSGSKTLRAPAVFPAPAGVKRAGFTLTDTLWMTVHANPENVEGDEHQMADFVAVQSYEEYEQYVIEQEKVALDKSE
jgi:hypothetical protein